MTREALDAAISATEMALERLRAARAALDARPATSGPPVVPAALPVTPQLIAELKRDEGLRLKAYPDPLSPRAKTGKGSGDPWTIGYGHTGPEVVEGLTWTDVQAEAALIADAEKHNAELLKACPWVVGLDPVRQRVVCNMAFNLGIRNLLGFKNTLAAMKRGDWDAAAGGMANSLWARQTKSRADRLVAMMRTGRAP